MRTCLLCLLVSVTGVSVGTRFAPTSEDLRKMYGKPSNVAPGRNGTPDSETFVLVEHIMLAAQYGADGQACILALEPSSITGPESERNHELLMSNTSTSEIMEQVAPTDKRGKVLPGSAIICAGYPGFATEDYENVYIHRDIRCTVTKGPASAIVLSDKRVRVWFKRTVCPKPDWYPSKSPSPPG